LPEPLEPLQNVTCRARVGSPLGLVDLAFVGVS
jgi:hypothetical protein